MRGEENSLGWYVRSSTEPFLIGVKLAGIVKKKKKNFGVAKI